MTLRDDVDEGLRVLDMGSTVPLALDAEGVCDVPILLPPRMRALADQRMVIRIDLAKSGRFFRLRAPIAHAADGLPAEAWQRMMNDHNHLDRLEGAHYAYDVELGLVFATYDWVLASITAPQFRELFHRFVGSSFVLLERMGAIAGSLRGVTALGEGKKA